MGKFIDEFKDHLEIQPSRPVQPYSKVESLALLFIAASCFFFSSLMLLAVFVIGENSGLHPKSP